MRWKLWVGKLAALLALVGGCKERVFLYECDRAHNYTTYMPERTEVEPNATTVATIQSVSKPPTILDPDREIRYISLSECMAISLEQGTTGNQNPNFTSVFLASDNLVQFGGRAISPNDQIRVLSLDPAITGATIESALSKFDAVWTSSMLWNNTDRPIGTSLETFQAGQTGVDAITSQDATFSTGVIKPLPTGGAAGITFNTAYNITNLPARVNPSYRPALQFQFEQPLLAGYGVEINQIRANHPGSILSPGVLNTQPTQEGILVSRVRFDQQRGEFQRNLHFLVNNVEQAYWNLYSGYWALYAQEAAMRQAYEAWKVSFAKYQAGRLSIADLAQSRGQYEQFRGQRITALNNLLENERQLRALLGMHSEDGTRLVPSDEPTLAPYTPDWDTALQEALALRPELFLAREEVKANQLNIIGAKNALLPDLRFTATYDLNGLGGRLDGADEGANALRSLSSNHFNNWTLGFRLNAPIGFRNAHAQLRVARLQLARSYEILKDNELKAERYLALQYRLISTNYEQIRAQRAEREAYGEQLRARFQEFLAGRGTLDLLLEAQRFWATALSAEYAAIGAYNQSIATFHFAKGTILEHDNIVVAEGALPACAQARAVEHQRERTAALVLRQRAEAIDHTPFGSSESSPSLPNLPDHRAPSLPALMEKAPEKLPPSPPEVKSTTPITALSTKEPLPALIATPRKKAEKKASDFGTISPAGAAPTTTPKPIATSATSKDESGVPATMTFSNPPDVSPLPPPPFPAQPSSGPPARSAAAVPMPPLGEYPVPSPIR